ncbi:MAG TPA: dihydrodipicolinate synthase family protein [Actinomycetota bacterium]|nr:dihydrodipicolinate synthase family protein [Actinomycetota bacterium]
MADAAAEHTPSAPPGPDPGGARAAPAGVLCALVTPLAADGCPDLAALAELVEFHAERGTHGLFVLGTTGEGALLDPGERKAVAEAAVERAGGRIPVVVHCGAADTRTVVDLARHAGTVGAVAVATVGPYYFRYREEDLYRHFAEVARGAPEVGHYLYQNPETVGYSLPVGLVLRLVEEVPGVLGVKDTGDSIGRITAYLAHRGRRPHVYVGNNALIFPALVVGARGAVSSLANVVPELVVGVVEAFWEGRLEEARERQFTLARLKEAMAGLPSVGAVKYLVERRGLPAGATRAPLPALGPKQAAALEERLAALDDLAPWLEPVGRPRGAALG